MSIYKNTDLEFSLQQGTEKGGVYTNFYTEDKGSASIRVRLSSNEYYLDLTKTDLKPVLFLFHEDGSIFEIRDFINVMPDKGLIQYKLSDNVIAHSGKVKAKLFLKNTEQSVHVANFTFDIKDSGIEGAVAKEISVNILEDTVRNVMTDNAMGLLDDEYKNKINQDVVEYISSNPELYKGPKGDTGSNGIKGEKGDKGDKGDTLKYADLSTSEKEDLKSNITDQAVTDFVIEDNSITSSKIADKSISYSKLSETYAGGPRIFNSDNINTLTKEGVYFKFSGANPTGLPSELAGEECFIEVRAWYATSTSNYVIQTITVNNSLNKIYRRVVKGGTTPSNFSVYDLTDKGHIVAKRTLESIDLNNVDEDGYFLGLSTNSYSNLPPELAGSSFLLRIESFASHQGFVIQTIYQTSGRIDVAFKRFVQVKVNEANVVGEWFKDTSLSGDNLVDTTGSQYPAIAGKNIVHFGDSLTEFGTYHSLLSSSSGANTTSVGFGGCRMANVPPEHFRYKYNEMSMVSVSESIKNNDYTALEVAAQSLKTNDNDDNTQQVARLKNIDFSQVDYITIMYGTNDYTSLVPLGEKESTNVEEFNGAINKVVENILTTYPHIKVLFLTPTWRARMDNGDGKESDTNANKNGNYLINYVDAILDRANKFKLPSYDLYRNSGINRFTTNHYQTDGLHLTNKGDEIIARTIGSQLSKF